MAVIQGYKNIEILNPLIKDVGFIGDISDDIIVTREPDSILIRHKDDKEINMRFLVYGQNIRYKTSVTTKEGIIQVRTDNDPICKCADIPIISDIYTRVTFGDNLANNNDSIRTINMINTTNMAVNIISKDSGCISLNTECQDLLIVMTPQYKPFTMASLIDIINPDVEHSWSKYWTGDQIASVGYLNYDSDLNLRLDRDFKIFGWHVVGSTIVLSVVPFDLVESNVINTMPYTMSQLLNQFKDMVKNDPAFAYFDFKVIKYNVVEGTSMISTEEISRHNVTLAKEGQDPATSMFLLQ